MKSISILLLIFLGAHAYPQKIVFSQDVKSDSVRPTKGPNLKNYIHTYFNFGFPFTTGDELNFTQPGSSMIVDYGIRYKRRLNNTFAVGFDLSANWAVYKIRQGSDNPIQDTVQYKKEKFQVNSLSPALYARFNVGRRGNSIGKFLDLGGYGSWNWRKAYRTSEKQDNDEIRQVSIKRLTYFEPFSYGLLARIGVNRFSLTGHYRLSKIFKDSSGFPELPRFSLGLEVALYNINKL